MTAMGKLYRASDDDYVDEGYSFAESPEIAALYAENPGFGGASIWVTTSSAKRSAAVDLRRDTSACLAEALGLRDPGAINIDEWIPRSSDVREALRRLGYQWAIVRESYPEDSSTWIWLGGDDEPELIPYV